MYPRCIRIGFCAEHLERKLFLVNILLMFAAENENSSLGMDRTKRWYLQMKMYFILWLNAKNVIWWDIPFDAIRQMWQQEMKLCFMSLLLLYHLKISDCRKFLSQWRTKKLNLIDYRIEPCLLFTFLFFFYCNLTVGLFTKYDNARNYGSKPSMRGSERKSIFNKYVTKEYWNHTEPCWAMCVMKKTKMAKTCL